MIKKIKEKILAYALKNALEHEGKAQVNSVLNSLFHEGLEKKDVSSIISNIQETTNQINSIPIEEQKKRFKKLKGEIDHRKKREGLPELPNVPKTGVIMRFAPAPSGPLHIGHIVSNMASSLYVKKYGGKFYIRIEDTNPEKIDPLAYEGIKKDCDWLFRNIHGYITQSERIKIYYEYAKDWIKKGFAYVCTCESEDFKELSIKNKPCPCRSLPVKENLERWKKMLDSKGYKEGEAVLRFKSDLYNPNPALRDFPLARINLTKHPKQGSKYRVWPLMNLSVTVDDIEYKMTHIIRGKDHRDNAERQKMIYAALGLEKKFPVTLFIGRLKFTDMEMSKRKITEAIKQGKFHDWEDVRLPTIAALRKRGYQPEAFAKMAVQRGISEVDKVMSQKDFFEILDNFNREILKGKCRKAEFERVAEKKANVLVLMPDGSKIHAKSGIKPKKEEIIYFIRLGYAKFNAKEKNDSVFYFLHE